jgi:hypothetical protein
MKLLKETRASLRILGSAAVAAAMLQGGAGASTSARGTIAGKVYDLESKELLSDVTVGVRAIDSDESFEVVTDPTGTYVLRDAPAGIYAFSLKAGSIEVPVKERMDLRVSMPFILESCFELDREKKAASVRAECRSGLVEEARVATIGPQRFLIPYRFQEQPAAAGDLPSVMPTAIEHAGIECITQEHFPQVDAGIRPGEKVQTSRVYFRSDKYPDFYYVEMTKEHPTIDDFQAILPKPGPETESIIYYLESVDAEFQNLQTLEFTPPVVEEEECRRRGAPWYDGDPSIVVGATQPGAAAIPPGFQSLGITGFVNSLGIVSAIGGGAGGAAAGTAAGTILVVGGASAAAATGIVVATGGDEASPPR